MRSGGRRHDRFNGRRLHEERRDILSPDGVLSPLQKHQLSEQRVLRGRRNLTAAQPFEVGTAHSFLGLYPEMNGNPRLSSTALTFWCFNSTDDLLRPLSHGRSARLCSRFLLLLLPCPRKQHVEGRGHRGIYFVDGPVLAHLDDFETEALELRNNRGFAT